MFAKCSIILPHVLIAGVKGERCSGEQWNMCWEISLPTWCIDCVQSKSVEDQLEPEGQCQECSKEELYIKKVQGGTIFLTRIISQLTE